MQNSNLETKDIESDSNEIDSIIWKHIDNTEYFDPQLLERKGKPDPEDVEAQSDSLESESDSDIKKFIKTSEKVRHEEEKRKEEEEAKKNVSCMTKLGIFLHILVMCIFCICVILFTLLLFANFLQYAFYPIIYGWISICSRDDYFFLTMTVFSILSDYGLYFTLISLLFNVVTFVKELIIGFVMKYIDKMKELYESQKFEWKNIFCSFLPYFGFIVFFISSLLYFSILEVTLSVIMLVVIFYYYVVPSFIMIKEAFKKIKENVLGFDDDDFYVDDEFQDKEDVMEAEMKEKKKEEKEKAQEFVNEQEKAFGILDNFNRFPLEYTQMVLSKKRSLEFKLFACLFTVIGLIFGLAIQLAAMSIVNLYGKIGIVLGAIIKALGFARAIDINIYDSIFHAKYKYMTLYLGDFSVWPYFITLLTYVVGILSLILANVYIFIKDMPNVTELNYIVNNESWNREYQVAESPSFCKTSHTMSYLSTDDYAVLATLPRLYEINGDATRCRIKPHLRGVFNSTMKYVFGENYKDDGISILCYPFCHNPTLVLTSEKFFNIKKNSIEMNGKVEIRENPFPPVSKDYFSGPLCKDGIAKEECLELKEGIEKGSPNVNKLWEKYTNKYWKNYKGNGKNPPGLEQYQYTLRQKIHPRIIDSEGNGHNGLHLIIGGGFEDQWGYGYLVESFVRIYVPTFFELFVPFVKIMYSFFSDVFNLLTEYVSGFIFAENLSYMEMNTFGLLMASFDFPHSSLFMIGHSISGSTMKEFSFVSDINGIVFEAGKSINYAKYRVNETYKQEKDHLNRITNIYSDGMILSGNDNKFKINGKLPKKFFNPNVYDDACLVAVTCSPTKKYTPFCMQVLNQGGADPVKKYNEIVDAFNKEYY